MESHFTLGHWHYEQRENIVSGRELACWEKNQADNEAKMEVVGSTAVLYKSRIAQENAS